MRTCGPIEMMFAVGLWSEAKMTEIEYFCESHSRCTSVPDGGC